MAWEGEEDGNGDGDESSEPTVNVSSLRSKFEIMKVEEPAAAPLARSVPEQQSLSEAARRTPPIKPNVAPKPILATKPTISTSKQARSTSPTQQPRSISPLPLLPPRRVPSPLSPSTMIATPFLPPPPTKFTRERSTASISKAILPARKTSTAMPASKDRHLPDRRFVNRLPPRLKTGTTEFAAANWNGKPLDAIGKYICVSGDSTRVWSMSSDQWTVPHLEFRGVSVAFKAMKQSNKEGSLVWVGTQEGMIFEINVRDSLIVERRNNVHRHPISHILRCGRAMITIDESGGLRVWRMGTSDASISLQQAPQVFRLNGRCRACVIAEGRLWASHGRTVGVYSPLEMNGEPFQVTPQQLSAPKLVGNITAVANLGSEDDRVFFAHDDGKISVYSKLKLECVELVNVATQNITAMCGTGTYLWVGFRTGVIRVLDVSKPQWVLLLEFRSQSSSIVSLVCDHSSLWRAGAIHVVSGDENGEIKIWDGMLFENWLQQSMYNQQDTFCTFESLKLLSFTWNVGACTPTHLERVKEDNDDILELFASGQAPDLVCIGLQELVDLDDKKLTAKSIIMGSRKESGYQQSVLSHQYREWQAKMLELLNTAMRSQSRSERYILLHSNSLVGLFTCVFVLEKHQPRISNVHSNTVKCGLGGLHGNKGAIVWRCIWDLTSICLINCHLAAGQSHVSNRNDDLVEICKGAVFPALLDAQTRTDCFLGGTDGSHILDHEICIVNGDMNYRIDLPRDTVIRNVQKGDTEKLYQHDQLHLECTTNPDHVLRSFTEPPLQFKPTYKYDVGTSRYDTGSKARTPAWCDRILYRSINGRVVNELYDRVEVMSSDHRPVFARFKFDTKLVESKKKKTAWDQVTANWNTYLEREKLRIKYFS